MNEAPLASPHGFSATALRPRSPAGPLPGPAAPRTILIAGGGTGGHLMPALAVAAALRELDPSVEPVLVGAERGVEGRILPARPFRHYLLPLEPIYRRAWWRNVRWPWLAIRLIRRIRRLLTDERPVAVLGTGGYVAGPVVYLAARAGIPTAIQEQNAYPGIATRWLSRRVRHIYLGLPEARQRLRLGSATEVFDTGNPIAPPVPARRAEALARFGLPGDRPVVLVTGGSQGALALNRAIAQWLERRDETPARPPEGTPTRPTEGTLTRPAERTPTQPAVLWVTGRGTHAEFARFHRPPEVQVIDFLEPMADGYAVADLVVSRAGMLTVAEICAWGLPSILVPLPTAAADHQTHNARILADVGAAILLPQRELDGAKLGREIETLLNDLARRQAMADAALRRGRPAAAQDIASRILALAS